MRRLLAQLQVVAPVGQQFAAHHGVLDLVLLVVLLAQSVAPLLE